MEVSEYYRHQAASRGHHTVQDVDRQAVTLYRLYEACVLDWLPGDRSAPIYEVACGPGLFMRWLRARGFTNFSGSDSSAADVALAEAAGLPAKVADSLAELRAMPENSCASIVALNFYEHLPREVLLDFLRDARRVLRPGGTLILQGPNGASPLVGTSYFNDITHVWALTPTAFGAVMSMIGFAHCEVRDDAIAGLQHGAWWKSFVTFVARLILRTLLRAATRQDVPILSPNMFVCAWK